MRRGACAAMALAVALASTTPAHAAGPPGRPVVIHDAGGTRPLAPLAAESGLAPWSEEEGAASSAEPASPPSAALFPVRSRTLTPGREPTRPLERAVPPVCLVGDDLRSLSWLRRNRERLIRLGASCLAVSVESETGWRRIREAAAGLPVAPAPGDAVAEALGIRHYPVLIGPEEIGP